MGSSCLKMIPLRLTCCPLEAFWGKQTHHWSSVAIFFLFQVEQKTLTIYNKKSLNKLNNKLITVVKENNP